MTKDQNRDRLIRGLNEIIVNAHFGPDITCRNCAHNVTRYEDSPDLDRCQRTGGFADLTRRFSSTACNTNFSGFTPKKNWFWRRIEIVLK